MLRLPTFSRYACRALPAPDVATEIFRAIGHRQRRPGEPRTVICPAFPVLDAVLNNPLPVPEMDTSSLAVSPSVPPAPAPLVLLSTRAPSVCVKLLTVERDAAGIAAPAVATEIVPPSPIVSVGVVTVIWPAFPVLAAVLNSPLRGSTARDRHGTRSP